MKTLHYPIIIATLVFVLAFHMGNTHDAHASCVTINGTEECSTYPQIFLLKSDYIPNDVIQITGSFDPNAMIQIDLVDPNNDTKKSTLVQSDSLGKFQKNLFIPNDAVNGTWKINTSSGLAYSTSYITVISKNLQEKSKEELDKKLVNARDTITNLMINKTSDIPFNEVGVIERNFTLEVGIDSTKATLSEEQYLEKIKAIVGDIPIKITFGVINLLANTTGNSGQSDSFSKPVMSPLKQLESGINPRDISCKEGLQLVIKSADKSPACLQPDTAYQLIYRGWAKEFVQSVLNKSQSSACEGPLVSPPGNHRTNTFPVLVMSTNSTAIVCVTYNFQSDWNSYPNKDVYPHGILETCCFIHMESSSTSESSNQFKVLANPPLFNVTGVLNGSKITVMYKIHAGPNSKGFYDTSVPFDYCESYPLAVGYDSSQVDATKFHPRFDIPCFYTIFTVDSVKIVTGMTYKEVQFP